MVLLPLIGDLLVVTVLSILSRARVMVLAVPVSLPSILIPVVPGGVSILILGPVSALRVGKTTMTPDTSLSILTCTTRAVSALFLIRAQVFTVVMVIAVLAPLLTRLVLIGASVVRVVFALPGMILAVIPSILTGLITILFIRVLTWVAVIALTIHARLGESPFSLFSSLGLCLPRFCGAVSCANSEYSVRPCPHLVSVYLIHSPGQVGI